MMIEEGGLERQRRIDRLITECRHRLFAGSVVDDRQMLAEHADLLPELEHALAKLREIYAARLAATAPRASVPSRLRYVGDFELLKSLV